MDNIVIVVPSTPTYGKAHKVYQYNYGQILRIQGLNLPKVAEVHFSYNETYGDSVTRIANTKDGVTDVLIPDSFLENNDSKTDYTVYAYIYLEDGTSGETVCKIDIPVKARSKPEVPGTPEEPELFRETVKAVNAAADRAEQAEQNAKASATEASKYATSASESADTAEKTKEDALRKVGEKKQEAIEAVQEQEETSVGKITTHTDDEIQRIQNQTVESKGELKQTIADAGVSKEELEHSIETAGTSKTALDKSVELAGTAKTELDMSTQKAGEAKTALDGSAKTASEMQETLSATVKQAGTLDTSLGEKIETGTQLNEDITASGEKAVQDIQNAGSEQLGKMQAVAEEFTADREQVAINKKDIGSIKEDLEDLDNSLFSKAVVDKEISITVQTDGYYYYLDGTFKSTTGRQYAIIDNIVPNKTYKLTTETQSALIAGVIYYNNSNQKIGYELLGTGTSHVYNKEILTVPENCVKMIVQSTTTSMTMHLYEEEEQKNTKFIRKVSYLDVNVGDNYATDSVVTLSGFTGDVESGFTHLPTGGGIIQLYNALFSAGNYLVEFNCSYTDGEAVRVGFENDYKVYTYKGNTHLTIPLVNSDGSKTLFFNSVKDNTEYTISNVKVRKIGEGTTTVTLENLETLSPDNAENYGFWNVVLGHNAFTRAIGGTRSVAIGNNSMAALKGGHRNIGIGTFSMSQMEKGENNVSFGCDSMLAVKAADDCVAMGKSAMYDGEYHANNIAIGAYAYSGTAESQSQHNVAVGANAGINATGNGNTLIGHQAGYRFTSAYNNVMIGFNALGRPTGYNNVCVGDNTEFANGTHNATALGSGVKTTKSDQVIIGNRNVTEVVFCGNKKIIFNADGSVTWEPLN